MVVNPRRDGAPRPFAASMQGVYLGAFAHAETAALAVAKYKRDPQGYLALLDELRPSNKAPKVKKAPKAKKGKKIEKKPTAPKGHKKIAKKKKAPNKKK